MSASLPPSAVLLGPRGSLEGVAVQAEASTALLVSNANVLITGIYRVFRNSDDFDTSPYTYNYTLGPNGLVRERVARNGPPGQASTVVFGDPCPTVSETANATSMYTLDQGQSRRKIHGNDETAAHIAVFVRTDIQQTVDFDSGERVKSAFTLSDTGHGSGCASRSTLDLDTAAV